MSTHNLPEYDTAEFRRRILAGLGSGLAPAAGSYDSIVLDPPAQPTTVTYRQGGPSGTVVATLTLAYSGSDVASVTRS